jgi:aspartyl-tRNA(Asn)/glutamyl-tRNA(Gln) amidotransferase subunit A
MTHPLDLPLADLARHLRNGDLSASELAEEVLRRHREHDPPLGAYKRLEPEEVRADARRADGILAGAGTPPPFCGLPVSVKDLYGMEGLPTFAGTPAALPDRWSRDAWLVARLRAQGAVFTGKTHTVELAFGGVGVNPHWGTPRNPRDSVVHRIPGGSSAGAGVSLVEGSAVVALGTDTGGSIRIPASMTGTVGHKTTAGRWPTEGVVPLSTTFDTVGALTRGVADSAWFFAAVDPEVGDPEAFLAELERRRDEPVRVAVPRCDLWDACQPELAAVLDGALDALVAGGWTRMESDGALLDRAERLYMTGGIAAAECAAFLREELPGWLDLLHPTVGERLRGAPSLESERYREAVRAQEGMARAAGELFRDADVLALPGHLLTPPPVEELEELDRYLEVNVATLRPTCPAGTLGLCALSLPVGTDDAGMPVGLQLVAPGGRDEELLGIALAAERILA